MGKFAINKTKFMICVTTVMFILSSVLMIFLLSTNQERRKEEVALLLESEKSKIQYAIDSRLLNLTTLEALVMQKGGMIDDFQAVAAKLYKEDPAIRCIQLAENGVITRETIYPYEGNESATGNLFLNPIRKEEAIYSRDNKVMLLAGPFELHQGGTGVVARRPIYLPDENGEDVFWGFSIQVMDLSVLLDIAEIPHLKTAGYHYQIYRYLPNSSEIQIISGLDTMPVGALSSEISVPGSTWYFSMIPSEGWISINSILMSFGALFTINVLTTALAWHYARIRRFLIRFKELSETDLLTGLKNNGKFYSILDELVASETAFAVFYLDLNKFKMINDTNGHVVGDHLLKETANHIQKLLPENADAFRIGGDEFAVLLRIEEGTDCEKFKNALNASASQIFSFHGAVMDVSTSCGYAVYPDDANDIKTILHIADARMYAEKPNADAALSLSNRDRFVSTMESAIREHEAKEKDIVFYFFHIDFANFKHINYHQGNLAGDDLIKKMVAYCNEIEECILCGQGFADHIFLLVKEPKTISLSEVKMKFDKQVARFIEQERRNYPKTRIAVWCGFSKVEDLNLRDAIGRANIGRSEAKLNNIESPIFVDDEMAQAYMRKKDLEQEAIISVQEERAIYYLQPQIDLASGQVVSAEVLGRLLGEDGEIIYPNDFIPVLEKTKEIVSFDLLMLKQACRDMRARLDAGKQIMPLSLNLSRLHIDHPESIREIQKIIGFYGLLPSYFCFEITESAVLEKNKELAKFCSALHGIGVSVSIDDFGAGCTSFSLLRDVNVDELKLDKTFLRGQNIYGERYAGIFGTIVDMARRLDARIICEGVETIEQHRFIQKFGVNLGQGYYYAKPNTPETIYESYLA